MTLLWKEGDVKTLFEPRLCVEAIVKGHLSIGEMELFTRLEEKLFCTDEGQW
jgi:hypothetical protein